MLRIDVISNVRLYLMKVSFCLLLAMFSEFLSFLDDIIAAMLVIVFVAINLVV